jgi:hypothetical protein
MAFELLNKRNTFAVSRINSQFYIITHLQWSPLGTEGATSNCSSELRRNSLPSIAVCMYVITPEVHKSRVQADIILNCVSGTKYLWILRMEFASCHPSGVWNFERALRHLEVFFLNLCTLELHNVCVCVCVRERDSNLDQKQHGFHTFLWFYYFIVSQASSLPLRSCEMGLLAKEEVLYVSSNT